MFASLVLILIHIKKKNCNSQRANQTHLKRPKLTPGWEEKARAVNLISLWLTSSYFRFTPLLRALFSQWTHIFLSSKCPHFKHNVYLSGTSFSHSHPSAIMFHETITEQNISLKSLQCPVSSFLGGLACHNMNMAYNLISLLCVSAFYSNRVWCQAVSQAVWGVRQPGSCCRSGGLCETGLPCANLSLPTQEITGSCSCRQPTCLSLSSSFSKLSTWFRRSQAYTRCNHEMDVAQKRVCSTCSGGGTLTLEVVRRRSSWHLDLRKVSKQDLSAIVKMFKLLQLQYLLHICNNK